MNFLLAGERGGGQQTLDYPHTINCAINSGLYKVFVKTPTQPQHNLTQPEVGFDLMFG